jgi:alkyl sulfatase BDS1-like metallo-beta-lactamase superfamily hydrolase
MVVKQYCGWWDDIPSHWSDAPFDRQAAMVCELAGGVDQVITKARSLSTTDPTMACHLADWAYFAEPENLEAAQAVIDVYRDRVLHGSRNTQELLVLLDHMTDARIRIMVAEGAS